MALKEFVLVNGKAFDHGSVLLFIDGEKVEGFKSIKYGHKRTRGKVTVGGRNRAPRAFTRGTYEAEDPTISLLRDTARALRDRLAARAGGTAYGDREFPIVVQYVEPGMPAVVDVMPRCVLSGDGGGTDDNADAHYEDVSFQTLSLRRNKKTLHSVR
ncbi:MAG: hypothetical protein HOW73_34670 [Polyangiaceae bacterium]|nr:hypothetical protein [Polyangiaceae bacterium]